MSRHNPHRPIRPKAGEGSWGWRRFKGRLTRPKTGSIPTVSSEESRQITDTLITEALDTGFIRLFDQSVLSQRISYNLAVRILKGLEFHDTLEESTQSALKHTDRNERHDLAAIEAGIKAARMAHTVAQARIAERATVGAS